MSKHKCRQDPVNRPLREAARWLIRLQHPKLSPQQLVRWSKWQELAANREAFDSLEPIWRALHSPVSDFNPARDRHAQLAALAKLQDQNTAPRGSKPPHSVSEEAAYWYFLCVDDPSMLRADRREFLTWMRRSPEHISELFKIAQLDGRLRRMKLTMRALGLTRAIVAGRSDSPHKLHREIPWLKGVAVAASTMFVVALAFVAKDYLQPEQVVTTGASQLHHMNLPDGTAVHVDARSRVEVAYSDQERVVHVYEGSAVFDVAQDPKRPFIARTPLIDATAVGTRFGVSVDTGVTTTVSEGAVKVTGRGPVDDKEVIVNAGEELRVTDSLLTSLHFEHVDAERKLQWSKGLLILSGMTVAEGVEQLNRRNRTQIVVESPALGARVIEFASVKVDSPETYAKMVATVPGVRMIIDEENGVIRLSE